MTNLDSLCISTQGDDADKKRKRNIDCDHDQAAAHACPTTSGGVEADSARPRSPSKAGVEPESAK